MSEFVRANRDFQSDSAADTKAWYDETIGKIKPVVDKIGTNSDMLKSPEGRSMIAATLNNIDYNKLSALRKSAEAMDQEKKIALQMQAQGKRINPDWYQPSYYQHSTIGPNGKINLYQAQSPLEYKDVKDVFDPYYENLKPTYRKDSHGNPIVHNGRFIQEITGKSISNITSPENVKAMASDPLVQKHVETDLKYGRIPKQFLDESGNIKDYYGYVAQKAKESQAAKIGVYGMETDPFALEALRFRHEQALKKKEQPQYQPPTQRSQQLVHGIEQSIMNAATSGKINRATGVDVSNVVTGKDLLDIYTSRYSAANQIKDVSDVPTIKKTQDKYYQAFSGGFKSDGRRGDVLLKSDGSMVGGISTDKIKDLRALQNAIKGGKFTNVVYVPTSKVDAHVLNSKNGPSAYDVMGVQKMYIPKSQLEKYNSDAREAIGATEVGDDYYQVNIKSNVLNSDTENSYMDASYDKDIYGSGYTKNYNEEYIKRNTPIRHN